jgi:hypothetical protein
VRKTQAARQLSLFGADGYTQWGQVPRIKNLGKMSRRFFREYSIAKHISLALRFMPRWEMSGFQFADRSFRTVAHMHLFQPLCKRPEFLR